MLNTCILTCTKPGDKVRICALDQQDQNILHKLTVFGLLPGIEVEVLQIAPAYVIRIGHTQLALDKEVACKVTVSL